jgi:hypothetical protein
MRHINRKSAPKVKAGRVQKKNNWAEAADYYNTDQSLPVVDRKRPGDGYRHILKQKDIHDFIAILPDWAELSTGLNGIVLAPGEDGTDGYHTPGVVHICAWEKDLWLSHSRDYYEEHRAIFARLEVVCEPDDWGILCKWTEPQARAYQLLHIFLHELGHHHDRMTTKSKVRASRGEPYAEAYARNYEAQIWTRYLDEFDLL